MLNNHPPEVAKGSLSPGSTDSGSFLTAGPQAGQPQGLGVPDQGHIPSAAGVRVAGPAPALEQCIDAVVSRAHARARIQPAPFPDDPWRANQLDGCTGIARLGLCICCDRLPQPGHQISPAAKRNAMGVYECSNQVIGGVHVCSVAPLDEGAHPQFDRDSCNELKQETDE